MQSGEWIIIGSREFQLGAVLSTGTGSYGQVWAATDATGQAVALKFINTEMMFQADPSLRGHWRAHLEREILFLKGLDAEQSRHIVRLLHHGSVDGQPVLVLERLAANLGQWLARQQRDNAPPPDLERILDWAGQILAGLDVIHGAGFTYRDLKFSNILVDERGEHLKVADFGSLKRESSDSTLSFTGTPATMAPEQALPVRFGPEGGEYIVDYRADYYALGLLLFSLLTRQSTTAAQRRLGQLLAQHGQEGTARHSDQLGGLNDAEQDLLQQSIEFWTVPSSVRANDRPAIQLAGLIRRLLARNPAERPQNRAEICTVFDRVLAGQSAPLTLTPATAGPQSDSSPDLPRPTPRPDRPRRVAGTVHRPTKWRRAAALAGLASVAGALAWTLILDPAKPPADTSPIPDAVIATNPARTQASREIPTPPTEAPVAPKAPDQAPAITDAAAPLPPAMIEPAVKPITAPVAPPAPTPKPVVDTAAPTPPVPTPKPVVDTTAPIQADQPPAPVPATPRAPATVNPAAVGRALPVRPKAVARRQPARTLDEHRQPPPRPAPAVARPEPKPPAAPIPDIVPEPPRPAKPPPAAPRDKVALPTRMRPVAKESSAPAPVATRPTRPASARPVARTDPRPPPAPPALPPIRLESRPKPAAAPLPPINLVSRTSPAPAATSPRPVQAAPVPDPPARPAVATPTVPEIPPKPIQRRIDPVSRSQEDAVPTSSGIRRNVEEFTQWIGRTGASVGTEVQRRLNNADQAVTRWTRSGQGPQVERRDRWSERASGPNRGLYPDPAP